MRGIIIATEVEPTRSFIFITPSGMLVPQSAGTTRFTPAALAASNSFVWKSSIPALIALTRMSTPARVFLSSPGSSVAGLAMRTSTPLARKAATSGLLSERLKAMTVCMK